MGRSSASSPLLEGTGPMGRHPRRRRDHGAEYRLGANSPFLAQGHQTEADGHIRRTTGTHPYPCRSNCCIARRKQRKVTVTFRSDRQGSSVAARARVEREAPLLSSAIERCEDASHPGCDHLGKEGNRLKLRALVVEDEPADVELALRALRLADLEV